MRVHPRVPVGSILVDRIEVVAAHVSPPPEHATLRALKGEWVFTLVHHRLAPAIAGRHVTLPSPGEPPDPRAGRAGNAGVSIEPPGPRAGTAGASPALDAGAGAGRAITASDPQPPATLLRRWFHDVSPTDRVLASALSALEQALWDLAARAAGLPLYEALGYVHTGTGHPRAHGTALRRIPLHATLNRGIFDRSPEGFAAAARQAVSDGFRVVKCAPLDRVAPGGAQDQAERERLLRLAEDRVAAVRAAIGPTVDLMLDCHGRLLEDEAIRFASRMEPYRLRWLEEPVPWRPTLLTPPEPVSAGALSLTSSPGLGASLDAQTLTHHRHSLSR